MLSQALIFVFLSISFASAFSKFGKRDEEDLTTYSRILVQTKDANLGPTYVPPTPEQLAAMVTDANHEKQVSSGLYTRAQANAQRNATMAYLKARFGLDFANGVVVPGGQGIIAAGGWVMIPYYAVNSTVVSFDSCNLLRGLSQNWYASQYGEVLLAQVSGSFAGGDHVGEKFVAGDVLTRFEYNLLRAGAVFPNLPINREVVTVQTPWISKNVMGSQGFIDSLTKAEIIDKNGNVGFFWESIMYVKDVVSNNIYLKTRVLSTWD